VTNSERSSECVQFYEERNSGGKRNKFSNTTENTRWKRKSGWKRQQNFFQNQYFKNSGTADKAWNASNVIHFTRQDTQIPKLVIDDFNKVFIRRTIREFYLRERMTPTVSNCYWNWETGLMLRAVAVPQENLWRNLVFFEQNDQKYICWHHTA